MTVKQNKLQLIIMYPLTLFFIRTSVTSILATFALVLAGATQAYGAGLTAPGPKFQYNEQEIVNRMNTALAHPARYTGLFKSPPGLGRLATITNCKRQNNGEDRGNFMDTCDLTGVPVGTTANLQLITYHGSLSSVILEVENNIKSDAGLTAMAASLAEGALINAVDPLSQKHGLSAKTHEVLIMEGLAPDKNMNLNKKVRADGLTFAQYMIGDLVLNVSPTGFK